MTSLANPPSLADLDRELSRRSLVEFIRLGWHVVEPATPYIHGWHIDAIAEHLEAVSRGDIRNLVINMPPRHAKSLLVSVFWPVWEWTQHPERRWLYSSYAASLSIRDSLKCRRLIESPWFQERWGHVFQLTNDQNAKIRFDNDKTGYRIATSVGGAVTGEGGDRVIVDDPANVNDASSDLMRQRTIEWWDQAMSTRLNDPKTGVKVIVMQRVHQDDLSGHVLKQGGYEHLKLPAEYEGTKTVTCIGWEDPRTEPGQLLWPERFGEPELVALKRSMGAYAAAGQLQQRPAPLEGGLIKKAWWKFYHTLPALDGQIQSWDMAFKDTKASDFVAGQVWGHVGADRYLIDRFKKRVDFVESVRAVETMSDKHPLTRTKLVEDKANGPAVISTLRHKISGLIPVTPEGGKVARVNAVAPSIESGNVYLPHPDIAPWVDEFIEECAQFPNGAHDDEVDAMSQALLHLENRKGLMVSFI